jgi:endoglucanase
MPDAPKLLLDLSSLPTAAFVEDEVLDYVDAWAKRRKNLKVQLDKHGNRLLTTKGKGPRLIVVAHADHPAFVSGKTTDGLLHAGFRGGVLASCCKPGTKVRFSDVVAKVDEATGNEKDRLQSATFKVPRGKNVQPGVAGNFDFGKPAKVVRNRLVAQACDDLAGLAACLEALDKLRNKPKLPFGVLVTRAEEVGFIGAIAAAREVGKGLLRKDDRIISVETSAEQQAAPVGGGCVLRVGDKRSVFHSGFLHFLDTIGEELVKKDKMFKFNRALMPGGTCEATAFDAFGFTVAAMCVPLGNYHNMDRKASAMAAEEIDLNDWDCLVKFLVNVGRRIGEFDPKPTNLKKRLTERLTKLKTMYDDPSQEMPDV